MFMSNLLMSALIVSGGRSTKTSDGMKEPGTLDEVVSTTNIYSSHKILILHRFRYNRSGLKAPVRVRVAVH